MNAHLNKCITEFIGTFFLVLTIGYMSLMSSSHAPFAIGAILMVMIYAGAHISGAHYNPAVTAAVYLRGRLPSQLIPHYFFSQSLGAIVAAIIINMTNADLFKKLIALIHAEALHHYPLHPIIAEFLFTFALAYVVLNVATSRATTGNSFYGLAIGFTVLAGAYAVGTISGAAFNPAVVLGLCFMGASWSLFLIYLVAQFAGAAAAAYVFRFINPDDK